MSNFQVFILVSGFTLICNLALAGAVHPQTLWGKNEVSVCWVDDNVRFNGKVASEAVCNPSIFDKFYREPLVMPSAEIKESVKKIISRQFSSRNTGIHFVGWEDCVDDDSSDVILFFQVAQRNYEAGGASSIGNCGVGPDDIPREGKPGLILKLVHADDYLTPLYSIHEFGHLAGLLHEDQFNKKKYVDSYLKHKPDYVRSYTSFDYQSIMSHEFMELIWKAHEEADMPGNQDLVEYRNKVRIQLSSGDLKTLRQIYKK